MKRITAALLLGLATTVHAQTSAALFPKGSRILFQGDSITDGNRGRSADPNHILGHGYAFIIAAKYGEAFPADGLEFFNRGVSGNTVLNLRDRWQKDTLELKPNILSILIGVNDAAHGVSVADYEKVYDQLLSDTKAANTNIKLVICEPFTLPVGKMLADTNRLASVQELQVVARKLAAKHQAVFVPLQQALDDACKRAPADHWIWDGIHPTYSGHQILADAWVKAVGDASGTRTLPGFHFEYTPPPPRGQRQGK